SSPFRSKRQQYLIHLKAYQTPASRRIPLVNRLLPGTHPHFSRRLLQVRRLLLVPSTWSGVHREWPEPVLDDLSLYVSSSHFTSQITHICFLLLLNHTDWLSEPIIINNIDTHGR